jgi:hypothetical protein
MLRIQIKMICMLIKTGKRHFLVKSRHYDYISLIGRNDNIYSRPG